MVLIPTQIQNTALTLLSVSNHTNDKINDIFNHGCWCSKLNPENPSSNKNINNRVLGGSTIIDELDLVCKQWFIARRCTKTVEGLCWSGIYDSFPESYELDVEAEDLFCENGDACENELCNIDSYYLMQIEEIFYVGNYNFTVGNFECESEIKIGSSQACTPVYVRVAQWDGITMG